MALEITLKKSKLCQKNILFVGPSIWNKLSNDLNTATIFTHNYKKLVLKKLG